MFECGGLGISYFTYFFNENSWIFPLQIIHDQPIFGVIPRLHFSDKGSYVESSTKDYDQVHFSYHFALIISTTIKKLDGFQISFLGTISIVGWLFRLFAGLRRTKGMVQLGFVSCVHLQKKFLYHFLGVCFMDFCSLLALLW